MGSEPELKIRYSFVNSLDLECKHQLVNTTGGESICTKTVDLNTADVYSKLSELCLEQNADWLHVDVLYELKYDCPEMTVTYASDYTFWESSEFQTSLYSETQSICGNSLYHATLCAMPLVLVESEIDCPTSSCRPQEPFEDLYPGYFFPCSPPGPVQYSCPGTSTGNATWECGTDGNWVGSPDIL